MTVRTPTAADRTAVVPGIVDDDDAWPPPWAATIRAQTNPALATPRRRDDVDCHEAADGARTRWVLRQRSSGRYLRIGAIEKDAWELFDGDRSVLDVAKATAKTHRTLTLDIVEPFARTLDALGLVEGAPSDLVYGPLADHFRHEGLKGRLLWVRETIMHRRFAVSTFGPFIDVTYRRVGRWLLSPIALVLMVLVAVPGFLAFLRLGPPNPLTIERRDLVIGALATLLCVAIHELAHAWTVRHFGREVCRAGVFLMYGMPGAFVDTTDMWLAPRRQRLWVTAAGPITNVVIGALAALMAVALPGQRPLWLTIAAGNFAFVGANLMPLLKLDGYYLLMDAVGVVDLRERGIGFVAAKLGPRVRDGWRRGDLLPHLDREERMLSIYGLIAFGWMLLIGASSLLVLPHRLESTAGQIASGELSGAPLVIIGTLTILTLVMVTLNVIANRHDLRAVMARIGRRFVRLGAGALLAWYLAGALVLAVLVPVMAGRRDADAGTEWTHASMVIAGLLLVRAARQLDRWTAGLPWQWLFRSLVLLGLACCVVGVFPRVDLLLSITSGLVLTIAVATAPRLTRSLDGRIGGAWLLIIVGCAGCLTGWGLPGRAGAASVAMGALLARLLWRHVPPGRTSILDRPANEAISEQRDGMHLGRATAAVAESVLRDAVDVLGEAARAELIFAFNAKLAGRHPVWFTADGRLTDRTTGTTSERGGPYRDVIEEILAVCRARIGEAFAADSLAAATLDLPTGVSRLFASHVGGRVAADAEARPIRLTVRHLVEQPLAAARGVFGPSVVERVSAVVNRTPSITASGMWMRTSGRLAGRSPDETASDLDPTSGRVLVGVVLDALAVEVGRTWTSRSATAAGDSLAWQLRERTAADGLLPERWGGSGGPAASAPPAVHWTPVVPAGAPTATARPATAPRDATTRDATVPRRATRIGAATAGPAAVHASPAAAGTIRRATPIAATPLADTRTAPAAHRPAVAAGRAAVTPRGTPTVLVVPIAVGAVVAVMLGAYGRLHPPTGQSDWHPFFSRMITFKSWSATAALACAVFQVASGMTVHRRRDPRATASPLAAAHRLSGLVAFLLTLPVAFHCLWALGFDPSIGANRRFVHSVAGCLLYGAYATKILAVPRRGRPRWALPVLGSVLFCGFAVTVATSAGWFFTTQGVQW